MRRAAKWIGWLLAVGAVLVAGLFAAAWALSERALDKTWQVQDPPLAAAAASASLEHGRHLYATRGCSDCHGANGAGKLLVDAPHVKSGNIVILAGWSEARGAMVGRQFVQREAGEAFAAADFTTVLTPWPPELQHRMPTAVQAMGEISRAQCAWMRDTYPGAACGGGLVVCRLTRAGVELVRRPLDVEAMTA